MKYSKITIAFWILSSSLCSSSPAQNDSSQANQPHSGQTGWSRAHLAKPLGVAVDKENNLYVASVELRRVYKVDVSGKITIVAGTGKWGRVREGVPAITANLAGPSRVAVDDKGNLYIADTSSQHVYKVDTQGILTTVAGTGTAGRTGDGGLARAAALYAPDGVAVGSDGSIFILDGGGNRIRKVGSDGIIYTIAGTGEKGYAGDGGPATAAQLNFPSDIVMDQSGNLFVGDLINYRVRKIDRRGIISTVAGTGINGNLPASSALRTTVHPDSIAVDDEGNLFILGEGSGWIVKVDRNGSVTRVVEAGVPGIVKPPLNAPFAVAVYHLGNLYFADYVGDFEATTATRIQKVTGGVITTVFSDEIIPLQ